MDRIEVTTDLYAEPWADITDPPFGTVERLGLVRCTEHPATVAMLVRTENGYVVATLDLSLYVKASSALIKAAAQ